MGTEQKGDVERCVGNGEDRLETGRQVREKRLLVTLVGWLGSRCWGITKMGLKGREAGLVWGLAVSEGYWE